MSNESKAGATPPFDDRDFPAGLGLAEAVLLGDSLGMSGAQVWHVVWPDREAYLKAQPIAGGTSLERDRHLLDWLRDRVPVPEVLAFLRDQAHEYLLMSAIPGQPASDDVFLQTPEHTVRLLAEALRQLHALPLAGCPHTYQLQQKLADAAANIAAGRVDEADFEASQLGLSASEVYQQLLEILPAEPEDLVFTHGDACLPNFMLAGNQFQGYIDIGCAGVADRWQDLALLARSLNHNGYTKEHITLFFEAYGVELNQAKLDFYVLLDEFF